MNRSATICGLVGALLSGLCLANDASVEEGLRARWTAAYNSGDVEALGAMYAVDARLQQGYCEVVTGRDAIEDFWRGDLGDGNSKTYLEIQDTLSLDGLVYLRGRYVVEIEATPAASARRLGGTYSQIWRHEDATGWSIHRETWANLACVNVAPTPAPPVEGPSGTATAI